MNTIAVPFNDIEIAKMNDLIEAGQGYSKKSRCTCGRHDRIDFYLVLEAEDKVRLDDGTTMDREEYEGML